MAVALANLARAVDLTSETPFFENGRIRPQTHCPPHIVLLEIFLLFRQNINHRHFSLRINFGCMCLLQTRYMTRIFNHRQLHPITETEVWNPSLTGKFDHRNLTLDTPLAEAPGYQETMIVTEFR